MNTQNTLEKLDILGDFTPTTELVYFKEILHDRLSDEEILELRVSPELHYEKLVPFQLSRIRTIVESDQTFLWLTVKNPELLQFELEKPLYLQKLRALALEDAVEWEDGGIDNKTRALQLKAVELVLKQLEKTSTSRKQKSAPKDDPAALEAKLLKAMPKEYAKLSEFELTVQKKRCNELITGGK